MLMILSADKLKLMSNITQVANEDKHMTTLKKSVAASGVDKVLSGAGPKMNPNKFWQNN